VIAGAQRLCKLVLTCRDPAEHGLHHHLALGRDGKIIPPTITGSIFAANHRSLADPTLVHQVLMNLGTNAAHAMRGSVGRLTVELDEAVLGQANPGPHTELLPGRYARLSVRDGDEVVYLIGVEGPHFVDTGWRAGTWLPWSSRGGASDHRRRCAAASWP